MYVQILFKTVYHIVSLHYISNAMLVEIELSSIVPLTSAHSWGLEVYHDDADLGTGHH